MGISRIRALFGCCLSGAQCYARLEVDECYLLVIRNPRSVANSLIRRHGMDAVTAHLLWLVYVVPNLSKIANRPFVVTDYDMVMADPRPAA